MPALKDIFEVAFLLNYNTRLVVLTTAMLGLASGLIGSFMLLRKRSLMGDALSHATLPGIVVAFWLMAAWGGSGKFLPGLLLGAALAAGLGLLGVLAIIRFTRLKDDAGMGIILSVTFGLGVVLLTMVQALPQFSAAGLENFIYGKTASMLWQDGLLIGLICILTSVLCVLLFKEFTLICFDANYGSTQGWPVHTLDLIMLALACAVTIVGLQAVGLILIIAFLITPAAAARFWTESLRKMLLLSGLIGAASGWLGASISALLDDMPAGAVIVLVAAVMFGLSMFFGTSRGVLVRFLRHRHLRNKVARQHLLRAMYELLEEQARQRGDQHAVVNADVSFEALLDRRSWKPGPLRRLIRRQVRAEHIEKFETPRAQHGVTPPLAVKTCGDLRSQGMTLRLTEEGFGEAARVTRNHRLWEMYLIEHADIAPSHVDRDADAVEHVLGSDLVRQLEKALHQQRPLPTTVPTSPHRLDTPGGWS